MKTLLLTGFEPFLEFPINPTEKIVKELDGKQIGAYEITGLLLPVDYETTTAKMIDAVQTVKPDAVISLGLAAGRTAITPERIAINCRDGAQDNKGNSLQDSLIVAGGADGYFSTLPIRKFVNVLTEAGLPAQISNTAGTYLCNNTMYSVLHELNGSGLDIPAGFIHIPASHELALNTKKSMPSWSHQDLLKSIELIIEALD
ncbi:peptidase C15 [Bacillus sp. V3-13]|uniref:pyroglutamyl-peptidase I n=1 Tax=Bacillus sp. V3-13 TaxID=2053728 RepID=UPI000C77EF2F|nr:pyroglutamyl-peptidase I [Bacillus sp. V3-13]PLR76178.1 peptidase C15 [Bacillus sp. V3-13]